MFLKKLYTFRLDFEQELFGLMLSHLNFECSEESAEWENGTFCDHKFIFEICDFFDWFSWNKNVREVCQQKDIFWEKVSIH